MTILEALPWIPGIALFAILLLEQCCPIPKGKIPYGWWRLLAYRLSLKVNFPDRPLGQRQVAGLMSLLTLWGTIVLIFAMMRVLVLYPWAFDIAALYIALERRSLERAYQKIQNRHFPQQLPIARGDIQPWVSRDIRQLSQLGLIKAGIESLLLRHSRHTFGVLFWFMLGGGIGALGYRLLCELNQSWSAKRPGFRGFADIPVMIQAAADAIPQGLLAWCISPPWKDFHLKKEQAKQWFTPGSGKILASAGLLYDISLGGPADYQQKRWRRPRLGGLEAPTIYHWKKIQRHLQIVYWLWGCLTCVLFGFIHLPASL